MRDGWIGVFIDGNRRRRMRTIDGRLAVGNSRFTDKRLNPAGDINHLVPVFRAYAKLFLDDFHCYNHKTPKVNLGAKHQSAFGGFNCESAF